VVVDVVAVAVQPRDTYTLPFSQLWCGETVLSVVWRCNLDQVAETRQEMLRDRSRTAFIADLWIAMVFVNGAVACIALHAVFREEHGHERSARSRVGSRSCTIVAGTIRTVPARGPLPQ
jgi:hypothetical protein